MAIRTATTSFASIVSKTAFHRRLPIAGAISSVLSVSSSLVFANSFPLLRTQTASRARNFVGMAADNKTVPSIVVYVTVPNKEIGKKLADGLVKEKLAACVNRVPGVESVYMWQGEIQKDSEELLIIKTRESLLDALTEHVKANHEYDLPEVIALPVIGGNVAYLEWIKNCTRD